MKQLSMLFVLATSGILISQCAPPPVIEFTSAKTDGKTGIFQFELKLPGKKWDASNPVVKVIFNGKEVSDKDYAFEQSGGGVKGKLQFGNPPVPKGKQKIELKMKLNDGSTITQEATVDVKGFCCGGGEAESLQSSKKEIGIPSRRKSFAELLVTQIDQ